MDRFASTHRSAPSRPRLRALRAGDRAVTKEDGRVVSPTTGRAPRRRSRSSSQLEPAFIPDGKVTAGNSCSAERRRSRRGRHERPRARELGIIPKARIVASSVSGIDPEIMGIGPIEAMKRVLDQAGMTIEDVDVMELNEAFAAQVLPVCREVGLDSFDERFNPHGGAIALGHPYGMTGARIMCTLLDGPRGARRHDRSGDDVRRRRQGMAMIVERLSIEPARRGARRRLSALLIAGPRQVEVRLPGANSCLRASAGA